MAKQVVVTRVFKAPVELVWRAWTEDDLVMQWWGPEHFDAPMAKIDFRVGAKSLVAMRAPESFGGQTTYSIWEYTLIVPHQLIEFVQNLADSDGNKKQPAELGMPADFPMDVRTVVTFRELENAQTEMTVTEHADFGQMSHFAQLGLEQSMDKFGKLFA